MITQTPPDLLELLATSKQRLVEFSTNLAAASKWDEAQSAIEWAKQIDGMVAALKRGNGAALPSLARNSDTCAEVFIASSHVWQNRSLRWAGRGPEGSESR